jgi:2-succinyl-5-enolpyruvyl-6-hydroxy-3-cyclohexene-1-carboxylate synthase
MLGTSFAAPNHLCYCITGDLAFFYDLNALGNRHIGKNTRIILINNGVGVEFKKCYAMAYRLLGEEVDPYVAAKGHFGKKSPDLVKHMAEDLGFEYLAASDKTSFNSVKDRFLSVDSEKPLLLEVFINDADEGTALNVIHNRI